MKNVIHWSYMNNLPLCLYPWYHQLVRTDGTAAPCCAFSESIAPGGKKSEMPGIHHNEYFNSEWNNDLRTRMINHDIHPGCQLCIDTEKSGSFSNRLESFNGLGPKVDLIPIFELSLKETPAILSQEVDLSNVCNLKCRMCDSSRSSKWIQDEAALNRYKHRLRKSNWVLSNPESIYMLRFLGGEPMLHQEEIIKELRKVEKLGRLNELNLHFNSNMMQPILPELLDIFKQCKYVTINASIDGYELLNDYIRSDSDWNTIINNINEIHEFGKNNLSNFSWMPINTVTVFNINKMTELYNWLYKNFGNPGIPTPAILAVEPKEFSIVNLPIDVKKVLIKRYTKELERTTVFKNHYSALIAYLGNEKTMTTSSFLKTFRKNNGILDSRRNTKFSDVNPEMANWLKV